MSSFKNFAPLLSSLQDQADGKGTIAGSPLEEFLSIAGYEEPGGGGGGGGVTFPTVTLTFDENGMVSEITCDMTFAEFKAVWQEVKETYIDIDENEQNSMPYKNHTFDEGLSSEFDYWNICSWTDTIPVTVPEEVTEAFNLSDTGYYYCNDNNFYTSSDDPGL